MIIQSKRHPLKFYAFVSIGAIFLLSMGTILLFSSIYTLTKFQSTVKEYFMIIASFVIYLIALFFINTYRKNSPKIVLDKHSIKIGNDVFFLKDIKDITFTGKMPFKLIITFPMEGMAILFNNGSKKILFDDMYSNTHEIKLFLESIILKKQNLDFDCKKKIDRKEIRFEKEEIFKGNLFTSLRGITLWAFIGFFIYLFLFKTQKLQLGVFIFFVVFGTIWFLLHSWFMHYFCLSSNYLIVRNHNFTWKVKIYCLTDIKEVVFETQSNQPNCMRIITNDFRTKLYPAASLRDKTWIEMKKRLESKGVLVRNECIF